MGIIYTGEDTTSGSTDDLDFVELIAAADHVIRILSMRVGQSSEAADAQAEMMGITLKRASGSYTSGSGGATPTPRPHSFQAPATGATLEMSNTTIAVVGLGALDDLLADAFNVQVGWLYQPSPDEYIEISPAQAFIATMSKVPADAIDWHVSVTWEELGG